MGKITFIILINIYPGYIMQAAGMCYFHFKKNFIVQLKSEILNRRLKQKSQVIGLVHVLNISDSDCCGLLLPPGLLIALLQLNAAQFTKTTINLGYFWFHCCMLSKEKIPLFHCLERWCVKADFHATFSFVFCASMWNELENY